MLPKPPACVGCPAYGNGRGFVPDEIIQGSPLTVLGCGQTKDEELLGKPFAGKAGQWMERDFLPLAGGTRGKTVSLCNLVKCRWTDPDTKKKTDKLPKLTVLREVVEHCTRAHLHIPDSTTLVIAQGDEAWAYASNNVGPLIGKGEDDDSGKWRGYLAPEPKLGIPTLGVIAIRDLFKKRRYFVPSQWDWQKAKLIQKGQWPLPIPLCPNESDWSAYQHWFRLAHDAEYIVIDTEFDRYTKSLFLVGLGAYRADVLHGLQFRWIDGVARREQFTEDLRALVEKVPVVFHNAMADIPVIRQATGIGYGDYRQVEDTMLGQANLYSEWPHDLEFCDSMCGKHTKLKHLADTDPLLYNWGDVLSTHYVHQWNLKEFVKDPLSEKVYREQSLQLYAPRLDSLDDGIRVNKERAIELFELYGKRQLAAQRIAQIYTGYPFNIGSEKQLKSWLYTREGMPVQKDKQTKKPSIGEDAIAVLRRRYYDFDPEAEKDGLAPEQVYEYIAKGAHPLLEARAMYAGASQIISHYLKPLLKEP